MDTPPVREGKSAGVVHLVCGGLTLIWAIRALLSPDELPQYRSIEMPLLYQYGAGTIALIVGLILLAVGVVSWRAETPAPSPGTLVYIYEPAFLGPILGPPCILFGVMCLVAIPPYTAERGIVPGQLAAGLFLVLFSFGCAWVFLHYRRTAIIDPQTQRFEISYGKPFLVKRWSVPFSDYQAISMEVVERKRTRVHRLLAGGEGKKPQLITFFFNEVSAKQAAAEIAETARWTNLVS